MEISHVECHYLISVCLRRSVQDQCIVGRATDDAQVRQMIDDCHVVFIRQEHDLEPVQDVMLDQLPSDCRGNVRLHLLGDYVRAGLHRLNRSGVPP